MKKPPHGGFFKPEPLGQLNDGGKGEVVLRLQHP